MHDPKTPELLREEYSMYINLWKEARRIDGPTSRLARFFRHLSSQVAAELKLLAPTTAS